MKAPCWACKFRFAVVALVLAHSIFEIFVLIPQSQQCEAAARRVEKLLGRSRRIVLKK